MKILSIGLLAVAVTACSQSNPTPVPNTNAHAQLQNAPSSGAHTHTTTTGTSPDGPKRPPASTTRAAPSPHDSPSSWQFSLANSAMDGEVARALRVYTLKHDDGANEGIEVAFQCTASSHELTLKLTSAVGDPNNLSKDSAFVITTTPLIVHSRNVQYGTMMSGNDAGEPLYQAVTNTTGGHEHLVGRIKFNDGQPADIYPIGGTAYITMGHFSNVAMANLSQWAIVGLDGWARSERTAALSKDDLLAIQINDKFNKIAALKYAFPVVIELSNGAGTYDLIIDDSPAVNKLLDRCGGDGPVVSASELARYTK